MSDRISGNVSAAPNRGRITNIYKGRHKILHAMPVAIENKERWGVFDKFPAFF